MPPDAIGNLTFVFQEIIAHVKVWTIFSQRACFSSTYLWVSTQNYSPNFLIQKLFQFEIIYYLSIMIVVKVVTFLAISATFTNTVQVETTNMEMIAIQAATISAGVLKTECCFFQKGTNTNGFVLSCVNGQFCSLSLKPSYECFHMYIFLCILIYA